MITTSLTEASIRKVREELTQKFCSSAHAWMLRAPRCIDEKTAYMNGIMDAMSEYHKWNSLQFTHTAEALEKLFFN
jgi:hypothetical protein